MSLSTDRRVKTDRDEVFLEETRSICPVCKRVIAAELNVRDNRVILSKRCPEHGPFEALVYSDAELYLAQLRFNKPGTIPLEFQTEVHEGCPLDCGLCPDHKQHTCLGLIEVNSACNLDCPICFADSGHQPDGFALTLEQVSSMIDVFVAAEGEPEVLQFSGGEPTIHPRILEFVELAKGRGIRFVMLNTNGIRLARDRRFVSERARVGVAHVPAVRRLRAGHAPGDPRAGPAGDKARALDHCAEAGITVTLVAAVEKGVNEHEVGEIVRFGVRTPPSTASSSSPSRTPGDTACSTRSSA